MAHPRRRATLTCNQCGSTFEAKASDSDRRFCSHACYARSKGAPKVEAQCLNCGKTFSYYASMREGHYCSISCGVSARNRTDQNPSYHRDISGDKNPMYGKGQTGEKNGMYGRTREQNPAWKGGRKVRKDGYVLVKAPEGHPYPADKASGYILEHRLVMEQMIGRYLLPTEVVHHIDENPSNNAPENLQLFSNQAEHISQAHG